MRSYEINYHQKVDSEHSSVGDILRNQSKMDHLGNHWRKV